MTDPEQNALIDLTHFDFTFAIKKVDSRVGNVHVKHVSWPGLKKADSEETTTDITLHDCDSLISVGDSLVKQVFSNREDLAADYLCPDMSAIGGSEMTI